MPTLPAICDECGTVFDPHAIELGEGSHNIVVVGARAGPCPRCGGMGSIPNAVYSSIGGILNIALLEGYTPEQLDRIIALLRDASGRTADEIVDEVEAEAPALAGALRSLLVPKTPADLVGYLALIVASLTLLRTSATPAQPTQAQLEEIVSTAVTQVIEQTERQPPARTQTPSMQRQHDLPPRPGAAGRKPKKPKKKSRKW